jgi:thiamine biosynthesis protein ThiI
MNSIVVHYQELALKGRNRPWFVDRLVRNLREAGAGLGVAEVRPLMGRVEMVLAEGADVIALKERVGRLFGIANFAFADRVVPDVDAVAASLVRQLAGLPPASFRVRATRADKRFPLTSPELERMVGGRIHSEYGWKVDLDAPQRIAFIEIVPGAAFCSVERVAGPGGLPTGVSGRVACLLSGGIDSPVAAWRMMKRGCRAVFVHFHSYPVVSNASREKARQLARLLTRHQLRSRLVLVPFGELQRRLVVDVPPALRVVLYRRFMLRISECLAHRYRARALVTGEAVGQVASQTLENLSLIGQAATLPVLRPLVGMDKEEITVQARAIGTYETSILPDEDCCQVFTPKHPATRARPAEVEDVERALPVDELVEQALAGAEEEEYRVPAVEALAGPRP